MHSESASTNSTPSLRSQKGMTLLEIMIVLVILGGLIAVLATGLTKQLDKAKVKEAQIAISELGKALDMYYQDCNAYPTTSEGLQALVQAPPSCTNWGPDPYTKSIKKDPWNTPFVYESDGNTYLLKSLGADKREGGTGNGKDITSDQ
jgi:general secretion pathway protein G